MRSHTSDFLITYSCGVHIGEIGALILCASVDTSVKKQLCNVRAFLSCHCDVLQDPSRWPVLHVMEQLASQVYCATTHCNTLQHTATYCNTLQHTATRCNTLQHAATHHDTLQHTAMMHVVEQLASQVHCTATHCNTLQHTATHYNTLQHTATH